MLKKIQKRNGDIVPFDSVKIMNAISSANKTVEAEPMTPTDLVFLTEKVCQKLPENTIVTVEQVQDTVVMDLFVNESGEIFVETASRT